MSRLNITTGSLFVCIAGLQLHVAILYSRTGASDFTVTTTYLVAALFLIAAVLNFLAGAK